MASITLLVVRFVFRSMLTYFTWKFSWLIYLPLLSFIIKIAEISKTDHQFGFKGLLHGVRVEHVQDLSFNMKVSLELQMHELSYITQTQRESGKVT